MGSQVEPVPNWTTKDEVDAEEMVPPSGHTSTMLAAGPTGVLPPPVGGVDVGGDGGVTTGGGVLPDDGGVPTT